jgi:IS5 family transposase
MLGDIHIERGENELAERLYKEPLVLQIERNERKTALGTILRLAARASQGTDEFKAIYRSQRPIVERVISRLVRRGGRKARYRTRLRVQEQAHAKAAVENFVTMARRGLTWTGPGGWATV